MTNIAEILKNYPKGTKLYSPICGECYLYRVEYGEIIIKDNGGISCSFYEDGRQRPRGECLLFPSKENRDWSTFSPANRFRKGDFVYVSSTASTEIFIFKEINEKGFVQCFCTYDSEDGFIDGNYHFIGKLNEFFRLATEEERERLIEAIDENGYIWDPEKLELRKKEPEFKPFDNVLVRDGIGSVWRLAQYGFKSKDNAYNTVGGTWWAYCIPYEGNEHLLGTIENCE